MLIYLVEGRGREGGAIRASALPLLLFPPFPRVKKVLKLKGRSTIFPHAPLLKRKKSEYRPTGRGGDK